jgi:hypothetical protein
MPPYRTGLTATSAAAKSARSPSPRGRALSPQPRSRRAAVGALSPASPSPLPRKRAAAAAAARTDAARPAATRAASRADAAPATSRSDNIITHLSHVVLYVIYVVALLSCAHELFVVGNVQVTPLILAIVFFPLVETSMDMTGGTYVAYALINCVLCVLSGQWQRERRNSTFYWHYALAFLVSGAALVRWCRRCFGGSD